jgi:hypothetical protein
VHCHYLVYQAEQQLSCRLSNAVGCCRVPIRTSFVSFNLPSRKQGRSQLWGLKWSHVRSFLSIKYPLWESYLHIPLVFSLAFAILCWLNGFYCCSKRPKVSWFGTVRVGSGGNHGNMRTQETQSIYIYYNIICNALKPGKPNSKPIMWSGLYHPFIVWSMASQYICVYIV